MTDPIPSVTLHPVQRGVNVEAEARWLRESLLAWLDREFLPEAINQDIADRASQIYLRQRLEGEDDLGSLLLAIVVEMQGFDFSQSFYGEFAVANAVSDLILQSMGVDGCCGR
jgi:hypothetical protein